jgi:hypothetical protein
VAWEISVGNSDVWSLIHTKKPSFIAIDDKTFVNGTGDIRVIWAELPLFGQDF